MDKQSNTPIIFKIISTFVNDLAEIFKNHRPLLLYNRLLKKTPITNDEAIQTHISIFEKFCVKNRDSIMSMDGDKLEHKKILFSTKVYIDMEAVLKESDHDTKRSIFTHLLKLSAFIDPESSAKQTLKRMLETKDTSEEGSKEEKFLATMFDKVGKTVSQENIDSQNPMSVVTSMLSSGALNDLMTDMKTNLDSGDLDLGKLMGAVQGIMGQMPGGMGMMSGLMGGSK